MIEGDANEQIKKIIEKQFGIEVETIEDDALFDEDLKISELDLEDLISAIESKYHVSFEPEKAQTFKRLSDVVEYLYEISQDDQQ